MRDDLYFIVHKCRHIPQETVKECLQIPEFRVEIQRRVKNQFNVREHNIVGITEWLYTKGIVSEEIHKTIKKTKQIYCIDELQERLDSCCSYINRGVIYPCVWIPSFRVKIQQLIQSDTTIDDNTIHEILEVLSTTMYVQRHNKSFREEYVKQNGKFSLRLFNDDYYTLKKAYTNSRGYKNKYYRNSQKP